MNLNQGELKESWINQPVWLNALVDPRRLPWKRAHRAARQNLISAFPKKYRPRHLDRMPTAMQIELDKRTLNWQQLVRKYVGRELIPCEVTGGALAHRGLDAK